MITTAPDALKQQTQFEAGLQAETLSRLEHLGLMGDTSDHIIQVRKELYKGPGKSVTIGLRRQNSGPVLTSTDTAEGNEEDMDLETDEVFYDEYITGRKFRGVIEPNQISYDRKEEALLSISDQLANACAHSVMTQLSGDTLETEPTFYGHNTVNAPSNLLLADSANNTTEANVNTGQDEFSLDTALAVKERATRLGIRRAKVEGFADPIFVWLMAPEVLTTMKRNDTRVDNLMLNAMAGGLIDKNPAITGASFFYEGMLFVEAKRAKNGNDGAGSYLPNVWRNVFLGAQAGSYVMTRVGGSEKSFRWIYVHGDAERELGIYGAFVGGFKKLTFNSADHGIIVVSSYATTAAT